MNINELEPPADSTTASFQRLRQLKRDCAPTSNRHELATVLITACICEGFDTGPRIVGALMRLGFNGKHAGMMLSEGTGSNPQRHRWLRDEDGRYSLHVETAG